MLTRLLKLPKNRHFFLFGARGTGKSTLIRASFSENETLFIDLLDPEQEDRFARNPNELSSLVKGLDKKISTVVIDEIQKLPKLLDVVHSLIEKKEKYFVLTGSSARKLKHGGANLLAGRAFVYHLFPFSIFEYTSNIDLTQVLQFGQMPKLNEFSDAEDKIQFLNAYSYTYLKEEIWGEQLVRKLDPFRRFLEIAAQSNGKIINHSNLARDVGVDDKTVHSYFSILEDTLIGFLLEPFHSSFRKRLSQKPKFYFFDLGVTRSLARTLSLPLLPKTYAYGDSFEHLIILEIYKLCSYHHADYRLSYLRTKDDAEIDLIVERPGKALLCIEIKSSDQVREEDLSSYIGLCKDLEGCEAICLSKDTYVKQLGPILVLPWREGLNRYFN